MIVLAGVWGTLAAMISWGVLVITIPLLVLAALASKRPSRVRIHLDIARLAVSIVAILLMAAFVRVSTPGGFIVIALVLGGILGAVQGLAAKPVNADGELLVRKSAIGIALWGVGVVAMQAAGILSRTGTLQLGQSLAWFGAGVLAGTIIGRQRRLTEHARSRVVVHTLIALVSVSTLFGLMGALDPSARAADGRWVLVETRTNPYDAQTEFIVGITPDYFESPRYDGTFSRIEVAAEGISRHSRSVERGTEDYNINAVFNLATPPTDLVPGETVTLSASGSASGVHNGWNPFEQFEFRAEGVRLEGTTAFAIGLNPSYYSSSGSASPTFTVPSPSSAEAEIVIQAFLWNCPAVGVPSRVGTVVAHGHSGVRPEHRPAGDGWIVVRRHGSDRRDLPGRSDSVRCPDFPGRQ